MHCVNEKMLTACAVAVILASSVSLGQSPLDGWFVNGGVIDPMVNRASEWAPELSADELELYFGSTRAGGGDLYYRNGKNFMKVEIKVVNSDLVPSRPQQLFKDEYVRSRFPHSRNYDIGKDGRFLMIRPAEKRAEVTKFTLIVNWFEELKAKVPTSFLPKVDNGPR